MPKSEKTPNSNSRDLAQRVHTKLVAQRGMPTFEQLEELLQVAYLVSLGREEGAGIHCTFAYASQTSPDPKPPERVRQHRWTYAKLESVIPLRGE